ncbi:MAG: prolyl oligopeptidase family serine peptidase [Bacteroidales bacterium]|nr:prolyl oligopeptidase family serine peptidase [Bacteroidales bacterium]
MKTKLTIVSVLLIVFSLQANAQKPNLSSLTIKEIMSKNFTGNPPSRPQWSADSKTLFFNWNPDHGTKSGVYLIHPDEPQPVKSSRTELQKAIPAKAVWNPDKTRKLEKGEKGLMLINPRKKDTTILLRVAGRIGSYRFSSSGHKVVFTLDQNLYWIDLQTGQFRQLTNFVAKRPGEPKPQQKKLNDQDHWLMQEQARLFPELSRVQSRSSRSFYRSPRISGGLKGVIKPIYTDSFSVRNLILTPDEKHVTFSMNWPAKEPSKSTIMPVYVTRSGYTEVRNTRSKVGSLPGRMNIGILNIETDQLIQLQLNQIPGITDLPDYVTDYPEKYKNRKPEVRPVYLSGPIWSPNRKYAVVIANSFDNKDRWILRLNIQDGSLKLLDRQRDEAWIGGPGIGWGGSTGWMPDSRRFWFQSEESGYSHLYWVDLESGEKKALTSGHFEIYSPFLSKNHKWWYFTSNEVHPGVRHFYKMPLEGGKRIQITKMDGSNSVILSPDEKWLAIMYSFANRPVELYLKKNQPGAVPLQVTDSRSEAFKAYPWRIPEFITFKASDDAIVYARLYRPKAEKSNHAAVVFVHGAGYLQNAHKWWSSYYHEYMFHNILVDNGYTVLDMDYRGSAGYGRDWRTGIYRNMGGKDLSDQVDGARFLVHQYRIDPARIGIYGGSYGGFITLMAMFKAPGVFAAGAGLRSVTDWAHYNHGYTANILNTPVEDSLAYYRSSPINFAEGLQGHLLMCHGMMDNNVHFQDIVRLTQRLITLGKENWELAVYPLQSHSFTDPDAWTDEYRRIFKLFQQVLNQ